MTTSTRLIASTTTREKIIMQIEDYLCAPGRITLQDDPSAPLCFFIYRKPYNERLGGTESKKVERYRVIIKGKRFRFEYIA